MKPRLVCIGTHHKTGTIWMRKVWRRISAEQGIPFMQIYREKRLADVVPEGPQILVNWSSSFPQALFDRQDAVFLHIIRDPRDILLSGMRYHCSAPLGNEKFLRQKREDLGGMTYQEHLNALPDDLARLRFEMLEKHARTVEEMLRWPTDHPRATTLRYEDLIQDTDCALFRAILASWDIEGLGIDTAAKTYWDLSLFGGLADKTAMPDRTALHVSSGRAAQWQTKLPQEIAAEYSGTFGKVLKTLGYAEDDSWVSRCRPWATMAA